MANPENAPDFTLQDTHANNISLHELYTENNVVLLFFPLAFSSACTAEMCSIRDNLKVYQSIDADAVGISVDSRFALKAFKNAHNLNFKLLSDFNKEVSQKYGILQGDFLGMKGVSKRAVFVINKKGKIIHKEILDDASKQPDFYKVQEVLTEIE